MLAQALAWIARDVDGALALENFRDGETVGGNMALLAAVIEVGGLGLAAAHVDLVAGEAGDGGLGGFRGILQGPPGRGSGRRDEVGDVAGGKHAVAA